MRAPAALAAVPVLAGSALSLLCWRPLCSDVAVAGVAAAALALLAGIASAAADDPLSACVSTIAGFFLTGLSLGWVAADHVYNPTLLSWYRAHASPDPVIVEGALRDDASVTSYGVSLVIDVDRVGAERVFGGVRVSVGGALGPSTSTAWRAGRRVRLPVILREPSSYQDPGVPDEREALARRGVCLVGSVKSAALIERISDGSALSEASAAARHWARRRLAAAIAPTSERSAAITTAILIGDRSRLSHDDERRLQEAGTYHVIAISGGNIAILTALLLLMGRALLLPPSVAASGAIVSLLFYAQVTGPPPSVERAVAAAVIFLAARAIDHRGPSLNALAVAAVLAVASSPVAVFDAGFILSFGATLGILLGTPALLGPRAVGRGVLARRLRAFAEVARAVFAATVCAELALAPVSASLFGRVTFAGLFLNFVAIPLMTIVQIAGAVVLLTADSAFRIGEFAVWATHMSATGLVESARLVELAPWLSRTVHPPGWPIIGIYYAAAIALLSAKLRRFAVALVSVAAALILAGPPAFGRNTVRASQHPLRVVVLDVGQGDATLVSLPGNRALLVDAGGLAVHGSPAADGSTTGFDIGDRVVLRALRALGVSHLDGLVVTHGDPDHILGAPAILNAMRVNSIWEGVPVPPHAGLMALRGIALTRGIAWRTVQAGDRENFGDVELRVLHPPIPEWERQRIRNEDSVVLELRLGDVSILLAGDIGREGETAILSRLETGRLAVLKAGHHGSATSSTPELLASLRPGAVIFSAGLDNQFGHPHPSVVGRFEAIGTAIFRTDRDGAVFVETDGRVVDIHGWTGRSARLVRRTSTDARTTTSAGAYTTTRRHDDTTR